MSARPWFLRTRITLSFGVTVFLLVLTLAIISAGALRVTINEEINALTREELEEVQAYFAFRPRSKEEFATIAQEMVELHPDNPLAWKVWTSADGTPWSEFGSPELLGRAPSSRANEETPLALDGETRWITGPLTPELAVGILVDGAHQVARFELFLLQAAAFVFVSTGMATLAGFFVGRRVAGLLDRVARSTRTEEAADVWQANDAPEEIRTVVTALQDTLRRIRKESEHARLLTSGMAHELRSPLQNLMGETQVTLLRAREPSEYRRVLESQLEELSVLSRVVDNLVTLCADGQASRRMNQERFDLAAEVRLRLAREFDLARRREVRLELDVPGPLLVDGDRESLLLALRNVITNAIEWSPRGGSVAVKATSCEQGLELRVDDSGPGVPLERRARLFEPFQRGAAAQGRRVGFGIGLALTRSAIHAHGGTIEVGDAPLGGARFRIVLPVKVEVGGNGTVAAGANDLAATATP